jgi:hypothetical protein
MSHGLEPSVDCVVDAPDEVTPKAADRRRVAADARWAIESLRDIYVDRMTDRIRKSTIRRASESEGETS